VPAKPLDWNVVAAGSWNLAILTPSGLAMRAFGVPAGTPLELEIEVDRPGTFRVTRNKVTLSPSPTNLIATPKSDLTAGGLRAAANAITACMTSLPETPLTALGVNIRFRFEQLPNKVLKLCASDLEDFLSDREMTIVGKRTQRTVQWREGQLNMIVVERPNASGELLMNFHRASRSRAELMPWLTYVEDMVTLAERIERDLED
jgi:hypothetical protein